MSGPHVPDIRRVSLPGHQPYDWWSLVHFVSGATLGLLGVPGHGMVIALLAYEVIEAALRRWPVRGEKKGLFEHESWANIGADVVVGALGWFCTYWWSPLG